MGTLDVRKDVITVVGVQFFMGPDHLLWVIDLVHDQGHQQVNDSVAGYVYLKRNHISSHNLTTSCIKTRINNPGSKGQDEQERMQAHPLFISHDLRVVFQAVANPD